MSSTPTLFNSGTQRPQLSSCFLTTIPDDLAHLIARCVAQQPADRPASAGALREEIGQLRERYSWTDADARARWVSNPADSD